MNKTITIILILLSTISLFAQRGQRGGNMQKNGIIKGKILDNETKNPVPYANIALYKLRDSSLVTGVMTNNSGVFIMENLAYGRYFLTSDFIGYHKNTKSDIKINPRNNIFDCNVILLKRANQEIETVEVTAEKNNIDYKIDRKVINISKNLNATGGSLVDALESTPSINVDIDGNVMLRGNSSFLVLIDGKPSVLDASDILNQIPASAVENIEIITNPSAKFDPDGTAGIINVVMKKKHKSGFNGIINASAGTINKYSTNFLFNYRTKKVNFYVGAEYTNKTNFGNGSSTRASQIMEDTVHLLLSKSNMNRSHKSYSVKGGVDYYLNKKNTISFGGKYGYFGYFRNKYTSNTSNYSLGNFDNYKDTSFNENYFNTESLFGVQGMMYSSNLDFKHEFSKKGHEIIASFVISNRTGGIGNTNIEQITDETFNPLSSNTFPAKSKSFQDRSRTRYTYKIDYSYPINNKSKFEAGYQSRILGAGGTYIYENFDNNTGDWITDDVLSNDLYFSRKVHSLYTSYSGEFKGIQYMLGLRGEYTYRLIEQRKTNESFKIERPDFYPTLHLSKKLPKEQQVQLSYSRRVNRPRYWYLNPYPSYSDSYSRRVGNPDLQPEYTDSYELGYQNSIKKSFFSVEAFFHNTHNEISRIQEMGDSGIITYTFDNLDDAYSYGTELSANIGIAKWLKFFATSSIYNLTLKGEVEGVTKNVNSNNFSFRLNTTIIPYKNARFQISSNYMASSVTVQGYSKAWYSLDFAYKQSFFKRKFSVALKLKDPFKLQKFESVVEGTNFATTHIRNREQQVIILNLSYKINNYKQKRSKQERDDDY